MRIVDFQFLCEDMDDSRVMSTEDIFVYYSLLLFRLATYQKVPGSNLAWNTPFFFSKSGSNFFFWV